MPENETWAKISSKINIPVDQDAGIILEYAAMNNSIQVKQADVVLVDDFLDYPNPYSLSDLDYYAGKQSPNGPGMTYGVFSIIANEISPSGCSAYTYNLEGSKPYTRGYVYRLVPPSPRLEHWCRHRRFSSWSEILLLSLRHLLTLNLLCRPWFQFSEQLLDDYTLNGGTHPAYPFLTGIGGANRVAVFGYLGLRLMLDSLNVDPNLPPQIPHLVYRTIYWQGWPIKASSTQTHTTLRRAGKPLNNANSTFEHGAIPVTIGIEGSSLSGNSTVYHLKPDGTITIPNRQIGEIKTVPGNIAQCRPVHSNKDHVVGQFPLAAVDGAVSTKWQPVSSTAMSSLRVSLPEPFLPVTEFKFDWAQSPPKMYSVIFANSSDNSDAFKVAADDDVKISSPYVAKKAAEIVPYMSNTTNNTLSKPVYSGRYATLTILGNQALNGKKGVGASVAEFAIIASGGVDLTLGAREVLVT